MTGSATRTPTTPEAPRAAPETEYIGLPRGTQLWYRWFHRFISRLYFSRISVVNPQRLPDPRSGPVLYLGLHRNGAVDGFVYHAVLPGTHFMVSTQLSEGLLGRLFFDGIAVVRDKDRDRFPNHQAINRKALGQCQSLLRQGGELFIFPEGTSTLGPRHLRFRSGAARILADYLERGGTVRVIPLGVTYECPWAFRSRAEVIVGRPIATVLDEALSSRRKVVELKRRIRESLEEVGINVPSEEYQSLMRKLAYTATLGSPYGYYEVQKALERELPPALLSAWESLQPQLARCRLRYHRGLPLFPMRSMWLYAAFLAVLAPLVAAGALANCGPLAAGCWAGERLADDTNVISLWRILVGVPTFLVWVCCWAVAAVLAGTPALFLVYVAVTWLGLRCVYRFRKLSVAVHNGLRHPELREPLLAFRRSVIDALDAMQRPAPPANASSLAN